MNEVIICHNPKCGTLRNTPVVIRNAGIDPTVIDAEGKRV
jgi:arsenate reductase-like glutaredoxin family protein